MAPSTRTHRRAPRCHASCAREFALEHRLDVALTVISAVCLVLAVTHGAPGWWIGAACTGALPGARLAVGCVQVMLRLCALDLLVWYAEVVVRHAEVGVWAVLVLVALNQHPMPYAREQLVFESVCWVVVMWCVVRSLGQLGLHFLQHLVTLHDSPSNRLLQRRALVILATLYRRAKASGAAARATSPASVGPEAATGSATGAVTTAAADAKIAAPSHVSVAILPPPPPVGGTGGRSQLAPRR